MVDQKNGATTPDQVAFLPIDEIEENKVALREVDKKKAKYVQLVDSIRQYGIQNPISVRRSKNKETGKDVYVVVDGLHRYSASRDAGLSEIPAIIRDYGQDITKVWLAQMISNVHKIETRPHEYAEHIQRILSEDPTLSISELSAKLNQSPEWIQKILKLNNVKDERISNLINDGTISTSNAIYLAQLPEEEQPNFVDRAQTLSPSEFIPQATGRIKELRDAKRQGREAKPEEFVAIPTMRKFGEIKEELASPATGLSLIRTMNITNPADAWKLAMQWVTQTDPKSIEIRKQKEEDRKRIAAEEKEKKKKEREEQKAREAARLAAEVHTL